MHFETFTLPHVTGAAHESATTDIFMLRLSVDLHVSHAVEQDAAEWIYTDALLSGAGTYTREAFLNALSLFGGNITTSITNSVLTITAQARSQHADKLLGLLRTMLTAPTFADAELVRIKTNVVNGLELDKEDARGRATALMVNTLYGKTDRRYTEPIAAAQVAVKQVTREHLQALHDRALQQGWTVTVSGSPKAIARTKKLVADVKENRVPLTIKVAHTPKPVTKHVAITESIPSKHNLELSIGGPLPLTLHHPDYVPFNFGLAVLGKWGGFTGRLMSTVREKEGLTYGIYARTETTTAVEQGYWRIMTFFAPDKTEQGITSTLREITTITSKGITAREYERFKAILGTQQTLLNDTLPGTLADVHWYLQNGFSLDERTSFKAQLLAVTKRDVDRALKTYLNPNTLVIAAAGPIAKLPKKLASIIA